MVIVVLRSRPGINGSFTHLTPICNPNGTLRLPPAEATGHSLMIEYALTNSENKGPMPVF
jgi:hypothetical protein